MSSLFRGLFRRPDQPTYIQESVATRLPPEILLDIFERLHFNAALPIRGVCREWSLTVTALLYKDVLVRNERAVRCFVRTLNTTSLGALIVSLRIGGTLSESALTSSARWMFDAGWGWNTVMNTVLHKCPGLHHLVLDLMFGASVKYRIPAIGSPQQFTASLLKLEIVEPESAVALSSVYRRKWSHWLADSLATGTVALPMVEELTLKRLQIPTTQGAVKWSSFPRLKVFTLRDTKIRGISLSALVAPLLTSAAEKIETLNLERVELDGMVVGLAMVPWPSMPSLRMLRIIGSHMAETNITALVSAVGDTLEEFECGFYVSTAIKWPAFPRLRGLNWHGDHGSQTQAPFVDGILPALRHVQLAFVTRRVLERLQLSPSLDTLTLLYWNFPPGDGVRQDDAREFLPSLTNISIFRFRPGKFLSPEFHLFLPSNIRSLHVLSYVTKDVFEALISLLGEHTRLRYPLLKELHIEGDYVEESVERQRYLRAACVAMDMELHVHLVNEG